MYSSRIQAAVDYFGPTDLLQMNLDVTTPPGSIINHDAPDSPESQLIGFDGTGEGIGVLRNNLSNPNPPFPKKAALVQFANPIQHVTPEDPPVFIAHGTQDTLVPMNQSVRLATALDPADIEHVMRVVVGAGHGFGTQSATVDAEAIAFLTEQLARIPGDYNQNGIVDAADYVVWRKNFSGDQTKYNTWRTNFGASLGPGSGAAIPSAEPLSAAVPEPATVVLMIFAVVGWCLRQPTRIKSQKLIDADTRQQTTIFRELCDWQCL